MARGITTERVLLVRDAPTRFDPPAGLGARPSVRAVFGAIERIASLARSKQVVAELGLHDGTPHLHMRDGRVTLTDSYFRPAVTLDAALSLHSPPDDVQFDHPDLESRMAQSARRPCLVMRDPATGKPRSMLTEDGLFPFDRLGAWVPPPRPRSRRRRVPGRGPARGGAPPHSQATEAESAGSEGGGGVASTGREEGTGDRGRENVCRQV